MHTDHPITDYKTVVTGDAQFVDVREPDEVAQGTLPGTRNIPVGEIADRLSELESDKRVVVMCRSGGRSTTAAEILAAAGFGDVVNLSGGWLAWEKAQKRESGGGSFLSRFR